jgi:hypothetical protein
VKSIPYLFGVDQLSNSIPSDNRLLCGPKDLNPAGAGLHDLETGPGERGHIGHISIISPSI